MTTDRRIVRASAHEAAAIRRSGTSAAGHNFAFDAGIRWDIVDEACGRSTEKRESTLSYARG